MTREEAEKLAREIDGNALDVGTDLILRIAAKEWNAGVDAADEALAKAFNFSCPACGSEPWTNIDCKACGTFRALKREVK